MNIWNRKQFETYKTVRFLKFCNPVGKGPDKLFAQSELQENNRSHSGEL